MSGFIAMQRDAFSHPLLKDGERFRAWFWLVANAAWKQTRHDARGKTIIVERGQICAGREHLAKEWGWSPSAVERFLTRLETEQMIGRETGQGKSIITICNYDKYQDCAPETGQTSGQQTGQKSDRNRTAKEQGNKETRVEEDTDVSPSTARKRASAPEGRSKPPSVIPDRPDDVSDQVWTDFLAHRQRLKADVSETVITGFRREADRVGWPLEQAMAESILRGWRGFKADWIEKNGRTDGDHGNRGQANRGNAYGYRGGGDGFTRALDRLDASLAERRDGLPGYPP